MVKYRLCPTRPKFCDLSAFEFRPYKNISHAEKRLKMALKWARMAHKAKRHSTTEKRQRKKAHRARKTPTERRNEKNDRQRVRHDPNGSTERKKRLPRSANRERLKNYAFLIRYKKKYNSVSVIIPAARPPVFRFRFFRRNLII